MRLMALSRFFEQATHDDRLTSWHLVVYLALFECWHRESFANPVSITRQQIMLLSKVSVSTYHKCMKELNAWGYINYMPSYHPVHGSLVHMKESI